MNDSGIELDRPTVNDQLSPYLAEYEALRKEIEWLLRGATQYHNFCIVLIGAFATFGAWAAEKEKVLLIPFLLTASMVFSLLGYLYFRQHEEVFIVASYIKDTLRPRVRAILSDNAIWEWEEYKAKKVREDSWFLKPQIVALFRVLVFAFPSVLSILLVCGSVVEIGLTTLLNTYSAFMIYVLSTWLAGDIVAILAFLAYILNNGDLSRQLFATKKAAPQLE